MFDETWQLLSCLRCSSWKTPHSFLGTGTCYPVTGRPLHSAMLIKWQGPLSNPWSSNSLYGVADPCYSSHFPLQSRGYRTSSEADRDRNLKLKSLNLQRDSLIDYLTWWSLGSVRGSMQDEYERWRRGRNWRHLPETESTWSPAAQSFSAINLNTL